MSASSRVVLQSICCGILLRYHLLPDLHDAGACCLLSFVQVPYVKKVGDVIDEIEDGKTASLP